MTPTKEKYFTLHRIIFRGCCDHSEFYLRSGTNNLGQRDFCTDAFANSFYVDQWQNHTSVKNLALRVTGKGKARVKVFMRKWCWSPKQLLDKTISLTEKDPESVLRLPHFGIYPKYARLNVHVEPVHGEIQIQDLEFVTSTQPKQAKLAIILRTYGRPDDILHLTQELARCLPEKVADAFVLILDASNRKSQIDESLLPDDFNAGRFLLLRSPNFGSGGNVSLGLLAAKHLGTFSPTDFLILDDDVWLDPDVIERYYAFCCYRKSSLLVSGTILSKKDPHIIYETASLYGKNPDEREGASPGHPTTLTPCNHNVDPTDIATLDRLALPVECNYSSFVFFGFPAEIVDQAGFPAPFFLKGDDVEYSLRLGAIGCPTVALPGLYAWHDPYWVSHHITAEFLAYLHMNILAASHLNLAAGTVVSCFNKRIDEHLRHFDYVGARIYLWAWETLLHPPDSLVTEDFCVWYESTMAELKRRYSDTVTSLPPAEASRLWDFWSHKPLVPPKRYQLAMLLTKGGHLTPNFLRTSTYCAFTYYNERFPRTLWAKSVVMANPVSGDNRVCRPDYKEYKRLSGAARALSRLTLATYDAARETWRTRLAQATKTDFWKKMGASRLSSFKFVKGNEEAFSAFLGYIESGAAAHNPESPLHDQSASC